MENSCFCRVFSSAVKASQRSVADAARWTDGWIPNVDLFQVVSRD